MGAMAIPPPSSPDPDTDPFRPPDIPTEVQCIRCGHEFESYLIEWRKWRERGEDFGAWCCPTPDCAGRGFGFDLLPTDPDYDSEQRAGWFADDPFAEDDDDAEPTVDPLIDPASTDTGPMIDPLIWLDEDTGPRSDRPDEEDDPSY